VQSVHAVCAWARVPLVSSRAALGAVLAAPGAVLAAPGAVRARVLACF
jgi:hypothetical protein